MNEQIQVDGYRIIEKLGEGGMAEVFLAVKPGLHEARKVAVKRLRRNFHEEDEDLRDLFEAELQLVSQLHHPNIVQSLDLGVADDGHFYLVMEYIQGADLHKVLRAHRGTQLPLEVAVQIATQAAAALDYVHTSNLAVIHRDVSPSNILLGEHGEVKLADFGIARFRGRDVGTSINHLKGKLGYMSPEQFERLDYDHRSDLFSLGSVLYEMLTGIPAFQSHDGHTISYSMNRVLNHTPDPVRLVRPEVPAALSEVIEAMLRKNPDERIGTAADVRDVLLGLSIQHDPRILRRCVLRAKEHLFSRRGARQRGTARTSRSASRLAQGGGSDGDEGTRNVSLLELQLLDSTASPEMSGHAAKAKLVPDEADGAPTVFYRGAGSLATLGSTSASLLRPRDRSADDLGWCRRRSTPMMAASNARRAMRDVVHEDAALDELLSLPLASPTTNPKPTLSEQQWRPSPQVPAGERQQRAPLHSPRLKGSLALGAALVLGIGFGEMRSSHGRARSEDWPAHQPNVGGELQISSGHPQPIAQSTTELIAETEPALALPVANAFDLPAVPQFEPRLPVASPLGTSRRRQHSSNVRDEESTALPRSAKVRIVLSPWGHVWLDGHPLGVAPVELSTTPGKHRIDVGQGTPSLTEVVNLDEGENHLSFDL